MAAKRTGGEKVSSDRIMTPWLSSTDKGLIDRYCRKYGHKAGPGLLLAAMREIRREFGLPEEVVVPIEPIEKVAA